MPVYQTLAEAISSLSKDDTERVFCFQVNLAGAKKFQVMQLDQFWDMYQSLESKFYSEVILPNARAKLYFDLEFDMSLNAEKNGYEMVQKLVELLNAKLLLDFQHHNTKEDILVLESTFKKKFSCHLVFYRTVFENNGQIGAWVTQFLGCLNPEDRSLLTVRTQNDQQLFVDMSVYRKNQQFRVYKSRKLGKQNPLLISTISSCKFQDFTKESFYASLVTCVDQEVEALKIDKQCSDNTNVGGIKMFSTGKSPFSQIDTVIEGLVAPGRIASWSLHAPSNTYCFKIEGHQFCRNVQRSHRNSKVYYLFCVYTLTLWQQCFSPHCIGFKSEPIEVGDFSWLECFDEPWTG